MSAISTAPDDVAAEPVERLLVEPAEWVEEFGKVPEERTKFGIRILSKDLSKDVPADGSWARQVVFPPGFENNPHFHSAPQFQVLLEGSVQFPTHNMTAPAVHYADAFSPYGPFTCGEGFKIMIIRPWLAKKFNMFDRSKRGLRNPYGRNMYGQQNRNLYGQADSAGWVSVDGHQSQYLIGAPPAEHIEGPIAELVRLEPGTSIANDAALTEYALFVIVFDGEIRVKDETLTPYSSYFARGIHGEPMVAGAGGATILRCAFDENAHPRNMPAL
jgi:hypothetical protein